MSKEQAHRLWLRDVNQRKKDRLAERDEYGALCRNCFCDGNTECGHDPLNNAMMCTMDSDDDICHCCLIERKPMSDAELDNYTGQGRMAI